MKLSTSNQDAIKATHVSKALHKLANASIASHSKKFFKTGRGEYGEGDKFLGIRVPILRQQVKLFKEMPLKEVECLLKSRFHEERLCALLLLVKKYSRASADQQGDIYQLYLGNTKYINNWDLVDSSAYHIVGHYLAGRDRAPLYRLVGSSSLWERRIAILSCFHFIRNNHYSDCLELSRLLLSDKHDLIHKAVGWMLREVGNRDRQKEEIFLRKHYKKMPRTMLRYAIETFPEPLRKSYLRGWVSTIFSL